MHTEKGYSQIINYLKSKLATVSPEYQQALIEVASDRDLEKVKYYVELCRTKERMLTLKKTKVKTALDLA